MKFWIYFQLTNLPFIILKHTYFSEFYSIFFSSFLKWNIQQSKYTLGVKCKLNKLTSDPWETLEDLKNVYKGALNIPYVSF